MILASPLTGWLVDLAEVADPVFAERMLGDGVAIEPSLGEVRAPCAGEIVTLHRAGHALTLRAPNGAEILVHVGLDTVALNGAGFRPQVSAGDSVQPGQLLIAFDLDRVALGAKSLVTPVLLTSSGGLARLAQPGRIAAGDPLIEITTATADPSRAPSAPGIRRTTRIDLPHGIHARPAARIAELAKRFDAEISISHAGKIASARSPVALMSLGISHGADVAIEASGADAEAALSALDAILGAAKPDELRGVPAVRGIALGPVLFHLRRKIEVVEAGRGRELESAALATALDAVRRRLEASASPIFKAHRAMLDDAELLRRAQNLIAQGKSAGFAWSAALTGFGAALAAGNARMAERVADLRDLEAQVLNEIDGAGADPIAADGMIVIAEEFYPSDFIAFEAHRPAGLLSAAGGPTSHAAIIAGGVGLPFIVAAGPRCLAIEPGRLVALDAESGRIDVDPPDAGAIRQRIAERAARREAARQRSAGPCRTADGRRIEVFANLGAVAEIGAALAAGAEGCGLLRTEFLFLDRASPPDENEQFETYRAILDGFGGRPVIIRTLDIGGDKPAPYLPIPAEENPALGLRGIRIGFWRPEILRVQLRAILRAASFGDCRIMAPMIASPSELTALRHMLREEAEELGLTSCPSLGVMVETPAAAIATDLLGKEADFFSIGTNDLTQYCLAMDRGNPSIAKDVDALHPAVLRLIAAAAEGAARTGRPIGMCGALASDPAAAPLLVGLGIGELSAVTSAIPEVKAAIAASDAERCRVLAREALDCASAAAVRQMLARA